MRAAFIQCLVLVCFIIAYCVQPLLVDVIKFSGGAHSSTFLILLPHYYAMVLVGVLPKEKPLMKSSWSDWRKGILLSSLDIINQLLKKAGLVFAGAGIYIVVESSSMVWTVVWSKLLLQKRLNIAQWLSILLVTCGIALRSCQLTFHLANEEFVGVLLILASSILMGLTFVLFEMFVNHPTDPVPGPTLVFVMGVACSVVMSIWQLVWTVPQFDTLVTKQIEARNGNAYYVLICYILLLVAGWVHSATLWYILKVLGAVSSGVLKGLKVAGVFVLSHILFCDIQPSQCLNVWSGASATVCTIGVALYSIITASKGPTAPSAKTLDTSAITPTPSAPLLADDRSTRNVSSPTNRPLLVSTTNATKQKDRLHGLAGTIRGGGGDYKGAGEAAHVNTCATSEGRTNGRDS